MLLGWCWEWTKRKMNLHLIDSAAALEIPPMNYSQDQENAVPLNDVGHDPDLPNPQPVERVGATLDRLDALTEHTSFGCHITRKSLQGIANARPNRIF
jgi:hypothetical protein